MMNLTTLPNEIITTIYSYLAQKELYYAQLTCKTIKTVTFPLLVKIRIPISAKEFQENMDDNRNGQPVRLSLGICCDLEDEAGKYQQCTVLTMNHRTKKNETGAWSVIYTRFYNDSVWDVEYENESTTEAEKEYDQTHIKLAYKSLDTSLDLVTTMSMLYERYNCVKYDPLYVIKQIRNIIDERIQQCHTLSSTLANESNIEQSRHDVFIAVSILAPTMLYMGLAVYGNWSYLLTFNYKNATKEALRNVCNRIEKTYTTIKMLLR